MGKTMKITWSGDKYNKWGYLNDQKRFEYANLGTNSKLLYDDTKVYLVNSFQHAKEIAEQIVEEMYKKISSYELYLLVKHENISYYKFMELLNRLDDTGDASVNGYH
jgi:hypothetical protein